MAQVVIDNPVLNGPYSEPSRYRLFDDDGITNDVATGRRPSSYFVPIAAPRKKGKQLAFETEWIKERQRENDEINRIRARVTTWRQGGYSGVTATTRRLLEYWGDPERENKLFFCQLEALETVAYVTEAASKYGDAWIEGYLRQQNAEAGSALPRVALKMATGSGKTVVMAMLIAWNVLNKAANTQDARFSDSFLVVAPGITIRDRLRVLLPNDPGNLAGRIRARPVGARDRLIDQYLVVMLCGLTWSKSGPGDDSQAEAPLEPLRNITAEIFAK